MKQFLGEELVEGLLIDQVMEFLSVYATSLL
jgi:hypothetical protein